MTVLFSGRFDRVHPGHIATIQRLGNLFHVVRVVVLDYPASRYPIDSRMGVLTKILHRTMGTYFVSTNTENFEVISAETAQEAMKEVDVYASGNEKCVRHMHDLGYDVLWTQRSWDYEAHLEG